MEIQLIKIGTSKGVRLPAKVLKKFDNPDKFQLNVTEYGLFLKPMKEDIRSNWKEQYINSQSGCLADKFLEVKFS